jgi:hypothetical protein
MVSSPSPAGRLPSQRRERGAAFPGVGLAVRFSRLKARDGGYLDARHGMEASHRSPKLKPAGRAIWSRAFRPAV